VTDKRYLVHGVFWDRAPATAAGHDGGSPDLRVQPGDRPGVDLWARHFSLRATHR
jgi:hypothetical protein